MPGVNRFALCGHSLLVDATDANDWHLLIEVGDENALGTLFDRHKDYVFRLACGFLGERDLAEDVTQEVFLRMAKGRQRWRRQAKFTTWLYKMTFNTSHELRRGRQRQARLRDAIEPPPDLARAAEPATLIELQRLLEQLPDRQREIIVLRYLEGMSTREAAQHAGCSQGTVKAHLHRAFGNLRRSLSESER